MENTSSYQIVRHYTLTFLQRIILNEIAFAFIDTRQKTKVHEQQVEAQIKQDKGNKGNLLPGLKTEVRVTRISHLHAAGSALRALPDCDPQ
jgi:hypothetical protein